MYKILFMLCLLFSLNLGAVDLQLDKGKIQAHTEVFGDSEINPQTSSISSNLSIDEKIESLRGELSFKTLSLRSDNEQRDTNMYELLNAKVFPNISFKIASIQKNKDEFILKGTLTLNDIKKEISSKLNIFEKGNSLELKGDFTIKLTNFGIEPPSMFFVTVRDQIDIKYDLLYKKP